MIGKQIRLGNAWSRASRALLRLAIGILLLACTSLTSGSCARVGGDSVDDSRRIKVGGAELYVKIRGPNRSAPLLLWLHGGPGGPERPLFRYFNSGLERHFLVAYLDQRGAGRSFDRAADTTRLTVAQHLEDLDVVIDDLRQAYAKEKIYLVGHSWGTVLGLLHAKAHPKTVAALISVAPVVSFSEQQGREYDFDLRRPSVATNPIRSLNCENLACRPMKRSTRSLHSSGSQRATVVLTSSRATAPPLSFTAYCSALQHRGRYRGSSKDFMSPSGPCMRSWWASICARR